MLDLCAGFVYSQVLFTCVRLRLFDILFKEPLTTAALAERLSLSPEATCRLLDAAVSLGLAERRGRSLYGLGQLGAATPDSCRLFNSTMSLTLFCFFLLRRTHPP